MSRLIALCLACIVGLVIVVPASVGADHGNSGNIIRSVAGGGGAPVVTMRCTKGTHVFYRTHGAARAEVGPVGQITCATNLDAAVVGLVAAPPVEVLLVKNSGYVGRIIDLIDQIYWKYAISKPFRL